MVKVLLVSPNTSNSGHGVVYLTKLYQHIKEGCEVDIFVPKDTKINIELFASENIIKSDIGFSFISREEYAKYGKFGQLIRGVNRLNTGIKFYKTLIKYIKDKDYDVVHVLDSEYLSYIYLTKKIKKVKLVYTIHASDFSFQSFSIATLYKSSVAVFLKKALKSTSYVVCHGTWIKKRLLLAFPILKKKILGFNYPSNEFVDYEKQVIRKKLQIPKGTILISFLGMIRRDKRIETALDTIKLLPSHYKLLIAGSLSDYSQKDMDRIINDKKVSNRIITDFRYLTSQEFDSYFKAGDIFLSTHDKSFPSASGPISDARTYGLPVVVTPGGQLEEYVKSEKVGIVSKTPLAEDYSEAIIEITDKLETFKNSVVKASNSFSWKSFSRAHIELYNDINK
jgi:glycosyltransferase involved in cell wall biosynthesis